MLLTGMSKRPPAELRDLSTWTLRALRACAPSTRWDSDDGHSYHPPFHINLSAARLIPRSYICQHLLFLPSHVILSILPVPVNKRSNTEEQPEECKVQSLVIGSIWPCIPKRRMTDRRWVLLLLGNCLLYMLLLSRGWNGWVLGRAEVAAWVEGSPQ